MLQLQQNIGPRFGTSKMHLSPPVALAAVSSKAVVLLLIRCWLLLPLWDSVIVLCFVVRYFVSILVLQSSGWGRESWLLYFVCLPSVSWLLCGSSSWCHEFVCSLWCGISWSYSLNIFEILKVKINLLRFQGEILHVASLDIILYREWILRLVCTCGVGMQQNLV